jgi:DNA-binding NarL/FixJ family response regulator
MTAVYHHNVEPRSLPNAIRVMFYIKDELLRLGLMALLPSLSVEVDAYFATSTAELARFLEGEAPHVLVTSATHDAWRSDAAAPDHIRQRLVILDGHQAAEPSDLAGFPADGYLIRQNLTAEVLSRALGQLASGEMVIPVELGRKLLRQVSSTPQAGRPISLTMRETETLTLLVKGMSNKQIGRRLSISEHGAKRLVSSVLLKLDATNRTSAVVNAIRAGLVDSGDLGLEAH